MIWEPVSRQVMLLCGSAAGLVLIACGGAGSGATAAPPNPIPSVSALSPASVSAGSAAFTLTATGTGFVPSSVVEWNGAALVATYLGPSSVTAAVPASDVAVAGQAIIAVVNPAPGGGTSGAAAFTIGSATVSSAYIRRSASYSAYPGDTSSAWHVTLADVLAGSALYVVGTWPNFSSSYPSMAVTDGTNNYTLLGRYDDATKFNLGIQGTQSVGHWYASNVPAGTYTLAMAPAQGTFEDFVGIVAFEVAGVTASPLDGSAVGFQAHVTPDVDSIAVTVLSAGRDGILIAVAVDDVGATAPVTPRVGSGLTDAGPLWDFFGSGNPSARAGFALLSASGAHTAQFSPQEGGVQLPDYMTAVAFFDSSGGGVSAVARGGVRATSTGSRNIGSAERGAASIENSHDRTTSTEARASAPRPR